MMLLVTRERWRFRLGACAALLAGLLLRLWFIHHLSRIAGDSLIYGDIAKNWVLHGVYGFSEPGRIPGTTMLRPTLIRLPGYPLFLAACFRLFGMEHYGAVLYVQLAADLVTCWLAAGLDRRLFGARAYLPVILLAAVCPFTAQYVAAPLTETLVLTSIAVTFYAFTRWQQAGAGYNAWLGVLVAALSYSILLRPEQGLLAAAVVPAMLWTSLRSNDRRMRLHAAAPVLLASLCILLPLVPWTARNWHTFRVFQPLAPRAANDPGEIPTYGFNRWFRTWGIDFASTEDAYWNYNTDTIEPGDLPGRAFALGCLAHGTAESQPLYASTTALLDDYNRTTTNTPALDARFADLAKQRIRAAPICYYVVMPIARVLNMTFRPRTDMLPFPLVWWKPPASRRQTIFALGYAGLNLAYFAVALVGLRRAWTAPISPATRILLLAMAAAVALRIALLLTLDNSESRYTLELFPILFVWAGGLFARSTSTPA